MRVFHRAIVVSLPAQLVAGGAPKSDWPLCETPLATAPINDVITGPDKSHIECLLYLLSALSDPDPIYSRFDQTVGNRTVRGPGQAAAAVVTFAKQSARLCADLTGDGNLCAADPYAGAQSRPGRIGASAGLCGRGTFGDHRWSEFRVTTRCQKHRQIVEVIRVLAMDCARSVFR